ncbi:TetR/AcrR family transcriptional regulator [Nocardioides sp. AE5]|uniref:TetR/AcrR family transcriptional regulator n=1 Tax=Nocardioides sp. AE5 TaxID=2962573 RepID=UPI0028815F9C|nr:TetR/AcrR family transcriptional regulator [Nocardioides sp. AE5]MDT0201819.1 TetR/AcrR family transcriptional regulator [Nocardioides sp. AE5]
MARNVKHPDPPPDGRTSRWNDHRQQRRTELVAHAVAAIDRLGPAASVADIVAEAGVSKPVLYRYFSDKSELHAAVGAWAAQHVLDHVVPPLLTDAAIRDKVAAAVDGYFDAIATHPQVFLLVVQHRTAGDALTDGKEQIAATFARVIGDGLRRLGVDSAGAEPWAHGLVGLGLSVGEWWLVRRTMSQAAAARYLTDFVWHAFAGISDEYGVPLSVLDELPATVTPIRKEQP